jgi:hypothetical protein
VKFFAVYAVIFTAISALVMIPAHFAFNLSGSAILTHSYGFVVSLTFIHGAAPVVFVGLWLFLLTLAFVVLYRSLCLLFAPYLAASSQSICAYFSGKALAAMILYRSITLQLTVVTVSVNAFYVAALLHSDSLTRAELLTLQIVIGLFKLV